MSNSEAEKLVTDGRARWFGMPEAAENFARVSGGTYAGEIVRVSIYRYLVVLPS